MIYHLRTTIFLLLILLGPICYAQNIYDAAIKPADAVPEKYVPMLKFKRVALVINQTSRVGDVSLLDVMMREGVNIVRIMVPEHGFRGKEDAGAHIDNSVDSATHLPVISLYGKHKKPLPEDMKDIDIVVYDLQDVGVRFYTYISTLEYVMEACVENHKQLMILDRPNPNGWYVDGPVLEAEHKSFVGMQQVPVVYGMTEGEYADMLKGEGWISNANDLDMRVIKCSNYEHSRKYELPVAPSPNLRTMAAVYAYPGLCLFEGTQVSVGRGTSMPFQQYGCPEFAGKYAYSFTPQSGAGAKSPPYEGKVCYGEIAGENAGDVLRTINGRLYLGWLIKAYNAYPDKEKFFTPYFVQLCGTAKLQQQIKNGETEEQIRKSWEQDLEAFKKVRKKYLLYGE